MEADYGKATDKDGPFQIGVKAADSKHTNDISHILSGRALTWLLLVSNHRNVV